MGGLPRHEQSHLQHLPHLQDGATHSLQALSALQQMCGGIRPSLPMAGSLHREKEQVSSRWYNVGVAVALVGGDDTLVVGGVVCVYVCSVIVA